jgi:hypothetical protein
METTSEKMRNFYDQWKESGLSRMAFCKRERINYATFNYWHKQFSSDSKTGFEEIQVRPGSDVGSEIIFPSGVRMVFHSVPSVSWLKELIS